MENPFESLRTFNPDLYDGAEPYNQPFSGPLHQRYGTKWTEEEREAHKNNPFFDPNLRAVNGSKGGKSTLTNKKGIFDPNYDRTPAAIKAGKLSTGGVAVRDKQKGLFDPKNAAKMAEARSKLHKQMYQCLVTGYISNACGLSNYQKGKGIDYKDKSLRIKVSNL